MAQFGSSAVAGQPDPDLLQQLRILKGLTALPNNPMLGSGLTYNATFDWMETTYGGNTYVALRADGAGNIKGNVVPRTGTFNALRGIAGGAGELSSPTDQTGVFRHTGVANKAQYIGPEWVIDLSTLTNTDPILVPEGTTRVVAAFVAAQTSAVNTLDLSIAPAGASWKKGHKLTVEFIPRTSADTFTVVINSGAYTLSAALPVANITTGVVGIEDATRSYECFVDGRRHTRIGSPGEPGPVGEFSIAIGNGYSAGYGSTVIGSTTQPLLAVFPDCGSYASSLLLNEAVDAVSGVVALTSILTPGTPARLSTGSFATGLSYPTTASNLFSTYRLTIMVTDQNLTAMSRFTREFSVFPGNPGILGYSTVGTDLVAGGFTVGIATPTIDGSERLNVTVTCSAGGVAVAFLEYKAA